MDSELPQQADAKNHSGPGAVIFFTALGALYGITRFLYKRKVRAEEMARQQEFSVEVHSLPS